MEARLVHGRLMLVLIAGSRKVDDLDRDAASCVEWQGDEMTLRRWDRAKGTRPVERRRLDMAESRYVPVPGSGRRPPATSGGGAG